MQKFALFSCLLAFATSAAEPARLESTWTGIITLPLRLPAQQQAKAALLLTVIRDARAYEKFLKRIPKKQISRTRPAPTNKDPLLQKPKIDFAKHTLLVVEHPSLTWPIFRKITRGLKETVVTISFPRNQPLARPIHIGCYAALLVPKIDGSVRLNLVK